jgi:hypothetical protein
MLRLFASAAVVASVLIALLAGGLRLTSDPGIEVRYFLTSIWCVVPVAWGCWALLTPRNWLPQRIPMWGAILGAIAGMMAVFVLDLPGRFAGQPFPSWLRGIGVLFAAGVYYVLWMIVRRVYGSIVVPSSV